MATEKKIVSIEFDVKKRIDKQVEEILKQDSITLPKINSPLVEDYIKKIEGTYNVSRSKEDTDNAIDLLYIAYNTTPQKEGKIRVGIDQLMTRLIAAQQESELKMRGAVNDAGRIVTSLNNFFIDWKDLDSDDNQELKDFVGEDLFDLAEEIKDRAEKISKELTQIASTYDEIIIDTTKMTSQGEQALARRLDNKKEIEDEITKHNADRLKLESLVKDLQEEVRKYDKMAREYKQQAETAEKRAFIMSIVQVGAQMISSAIPAITKGVMGVATGGASVIGSAAFTTARQMTNAETTTTDDDNTAEVIETKKDISEQRAEEATLEREQTELEKKAQELLTEQSNIENNEKIDSDTQKQQLNAIKKRITRNNEKIAKKAEQLSASVSKLNALNEALKSLDKNMGKMADKQKKQATNLRTLQMNMLNKIEAFEKEKRTQAAELIKINALLIGQRTEAETIQLAIKSLNLSLKALKRVREIIIEISFFFKSFADFMQQIMENAGKQSTMIEKAIARETLSKRFTKRIKRNTNDFFVTQTAEWQAVEIVSAKFVDNFNDGWSKLNRLNGNYLTGDELKAYLDIAAEQIERISFSRKQRSLEKIAELSRYRDRIRAKA